MNRWCWTVCALLALTMLFGANDANAGSRNDKNKSKFTPEQLVDFSKQVERVAASQGARVFILSRLGRPQSDLTEGIQFTHTAIGVYSNITLEDGTTTPGYAIYNLYMKVGDDTKSELVMDFPVDFFAGAELLKAGITVPDEKVQKRLLELIQSGRYAKLHNPKYSTLSNPYNSQFQNCTEFVLDVLNAAIYQSVNKAQLKANTRAYFNAQPIKMSGLKLSLGAMFMDELTLEDHHSKVKTATFTTITNYLRDNDLLQHHEVVRWAE
ncbi:MAG: DUF2145 domain-containing protein [Algicola sp.]|nr:DUF2145 domain-containing protein [Algicola sp.]